MPFKVAGKRRIAKGAVNDDTFCHVDLMASIAALIATLPKGAGETDENLDGINPPGAGRWSMGWLKWREAPANPWKIILKRALIMRPSAGKYENRSV